EMPVSNIRFSDIQMQANEGVYISKASGVEIHDVTVTTDLGAAFEIIDSKAVVLDNIKTLKPLEHTPVVTLENVEELVLSNTVLFEPMDLFLSVSGKGNSAIYLQNNYTPNAAKYVDKSEEVKESAIIQR